MLYKRIVSFVMALILILTLSTFVLAQYTGTIRVGTIVLGNEPGGTAQYRQVIGGATIIGKVIKAAASQTADFIVMQNSTPNTIFQFTSLASMVDGIQFNPANTGNPSTVSVSAIGTDSNINLNLISKGTGVIQCNGAPCATAAPTLTIKKGSGTGTNYTTTSTSFVDVDATNLAYTVTVPSGSKVLINVSGYTSNDGAGVAGEVQLSDSTTALSTLTIVDTDNSNANIKSPFSLTYIFVGDGASHTFKLRFRSTNGLQIQSIWNVSSSQTAVMTFWLGTSN